VCGIAGWVDWHRDLSGHGDVVAGMTQTLAQRGPDSEGIWACGHAAFGHRRLAVIDIEGGRQPMRRPGRGGAFAVITFSGEIYNFQELREELRSYEWEFSTRSDTEVLLVAFLHWGRDVAAHLNGMYAVAVWDELKDELLLFRDRLGIKPLYYYVLPDGIVFGSEPKALLAHPQVKAELDMDGIAELMAVPRARTPGHAVYRGMREVKPGSIVAVRARGIQECRYWRLEARPHEHGPAETASHIRMLLEDIVAHQVIADVPIGALLSGGLDSSAITSLAARELAGTLTSYSVSVPQPSQPGADIWRPNPDEPYARLMSDWLGIRHFTTEVSSERLIEHLHVGLSARDLPGWGDLDTSMYLLFESVRENCTVALSGESADEIFGGYAWQRDARYMAHTSFPWMYARLQPAVLLRDELLHSLRPQLYEADRYHEALHEVPTLPSDDSLRRRRREVFYLGLTRWLGALLDRKDRMSMAVGLEVRVPFADHRLAEYLFNVPPNPADVTGPDKPLLRKACVGLLPPSILARPKSAYPVTRDDRYLRTLELAVLRLLDEPRSPILQILDPGKIRSAVASRADAFPGPITAATPAIGLSYLLQINHWLAEYDVRIVA
jgi:asparagine synthase (glutamine-hydrolysing)